ncbi:MAG TPA: hypothetical protein VM186_12875, partial [Planctomycetota bacterium]|nr:hypothetical protein [Planctomycetota bacterium]
MHKRNAQCPSADGEAFAFSNYGHIRIAGKQVTARGRFTAFRLAVREKGDITLMINGERASAKRDGDFLVWGKLPAANAAKQPDVPDIPAERSASLQYYFTPEEAHLSAGKDKQLELHIRCVGEGQANGQ